MRDGRRATFFGILAAVLGVLSLGVAAFWKNAIVNHEQTTDGYSAAVGVDALVIGAFVVLGGLLLVGAIILFVVGWFAGQHRNDENYTPDTVRPGDPYPTSDHSMLPPVEPSSTSGPDEAGFRPGQPHSPRF